VFFHHIPDVKAIGAHRGARSLAPENTLPAIEKALHCGAHFLEIDVRLTADGHLVVFHDDTPARTTNIAATPLAARATQHVDTFTLAELQSLDAGSWFAAADPHGTVKTGEITPQDAASFTSVAIPTLRQVLDFCRDHAFPINVEIKDHAGRVGDSAITAAVLELVADTETRDLALLSSFNHRYLTQAAVFDPDIPRAALIETAHPGNILDYLMFLDVAACHPDHRITPPDLARALLDDGLRVNLWTINDPDLARAYPPGVGIITDLPQRFV
jgi:glycerophosphoryl diester phosphodiesterase